MLKRISSLKWHFWLLLIVLLFYVAIIGISIADSGVPLFGDDYAYLYIVAQVILYFLALGLSSYVFNCRLGIITGAILGWLTIIQTAINPQFREHIVISILLTAIGVFICWIGMYTAKMKTQISETAEFIKRQAEKISDSLVEGERVNQEMRASEDRLRSVLDIAEGTRKYPEGRVGEKGYELGVDLFFNASHNVRTNGVPGPTHPHSWRIQARFTGDTTDKNGILVGFAEAKEIVQQRVSRFNGQLLNNITPFNEVPPTSENLSYYLYNDIRNKLDSLPLKLQSISIWESPTNFVTYSENGYVISNTTTD